MRLLQALTLSILIHFLLAWLIPRVLPEAPLTHAKPAIVELIEDAPQKKSRDEMGKEFVRAAPLPKQLLADKKQPSRFNSAEDQNVLQETRAATSGMTANRSETSDSQKSIPGLNQNRKAAAAPKKFAHSPDINSHLRPEMPALNSLDENGNIIAGRMKREKKDETLAPDDSKPLPLPNFGSFASQKGQSTVGEELPPDIKFGEFTALNTDRYLYYSFYARVEEMIRPRWVSLVRNSLFNFQNSKTKVTQEEWVTRVEIILDRKGYFVRGILHESSGMRDLDIAPVQAFREAWQIPNPPAEMLKEDGNVHMDYQFNVHFIPQYVAN
jgi:hypothetical protein